jgi:regulator of protease activity HflC (stomatin/prohibitin superfamily)
MTWIDAILSRIAELWPFVRVNTYQRGVRFRAGRNPTELAPGIHFAVWWFDDVHVVDVAEQPINLPTQTVTTRDDVPVTFSANVTYEIADVVQMYTSVQDFEDSINAIAMIHLAQRVRDWTWVELVEGQKELERSLKGTLTTRADRWGIKIIAVGFTDMVRARVHRLYGDPPIAY